MTIVFKLVEKEVTVLSPFKNFERDTWKIQYRTDPLTGKNTTIIPKLHEYGVRFLNTDKELLKNIVLASKENCPFCPENVLSRTPRFLPEEFNEGRLVKGEAIAFPNLIGHADKSAIVVLSRKHFLNLDEFSPNIIYDALILAREVLNKWVEIYNHVNYGFITFNYLPPAGSSIIHPHIQILARDRPAMLQRILIEKSIEYAWRYGGDFWSDLVKAEKEGGRYIGSTGDVDWVSPFAPLRGTFEIQGVVLGKSKPDELSDDSLISMANGISKTLSFYNSMKILSFNAVVIFGPLKHHLPEYSVNVRIVARAGISSLSFTDSWALPYLLWDGESTEYPEETAKKAREFFK